MHIDDTIKLLKKDIGKPTVLGLWAFHGLDRNECTGFVVKTSYAITKVVRQKEKIQVYIGVELLDWEIFQQEASRTFIEIVKKQISDRLPGTDDILDIVMIDSQEA